MSPGDARRRTTRTRIPQIYPPVSTFLATELPPPPPIHVHLAPQTRSDLALSLVIAALVCFAAANPSEATTFSFRCPPDCPDRDGAGRFLESEFRFDDSSLDFSWTALFEQVDGRLPDGFWLVVSEGRARNQSEDGLAILYGDGATGRVSAYVYDRESKRDSFSDPALFIDTFPGALAFTDQTGGRRLLELTLNAGTINSFSSDPGWRGLAFDEDIGIWAHASVGTEIPFASDRASPAADHSISTSILAMPKITLIATSP